MVIELLPHQPETTQRRGSLPSAVGMPSFREAPTQRCCDPGDALCTACTPQPKRFFPLYTQKPNLSLGGDAGDSVWCLITHSRVSS